MFINNKDVASVSCRLLVPKGAALGDLHNSWWTDTTRPHTGMMEEHGQCCKLRRHAVYTLVSLLIGVRQLVGTIDFLRVWGLDNWSCHFIVEHFSG